MASDPKQEDAILMLEHCKGGVITGGPGCLAGDTLINVNRAGKGFSITIEELVRKQREAVPGGKKTKAWDSNIPTQVARAVDGVVRLCLLKAAWSSGVKDTYELITATGRAIRTTDEHPFFTERGFVRLGELCAGQQVFVNVGRSTNGTARARGERANYKDARTRFHPRQRPCDHGFRTPVHHLVVEAALNGLLYEEFVQALRTDEARSRAFVYLEEGAVVHHKDENTYNNDLKNLVVTTQPLHAKEHAEVSGRHVLEQIGLETIESIRHHGIEETYDIEVEDDPHCFLANGFVVHNTGKTFCTKEGLLRLTGRSVALVAPTGKAARRMAEVTGFASSTIHKLLGLRPGAPPTYHPGNPLPHDVVLVDEASMLEVPLFARLIGAMDLTRTALFLIGDVNQLPSIGPGRVFADIIDSDVLPVVRLETVHRAASRSWVCRTAPMILEGRFDYTAADDFEFIEAGDEDVFAQELLSVTHTLVQKFGKEDVQVIAPMNVGDFGTNLMNSALQEILNPGDGDSFASNVAKGVSHRIRAGDRVVATSNDYDRVVFNGETGVVKNVEGRGHGSVVIDFYDREVEYSKSAANENVRLAYALSCHKVQGSEYRWVVVAIHEAHGRMLNRRLLYTAVTRAREGVVVIGQQSAVARALSVVEDTLRRTTLRQRLSEAGDGALV